MLVWRIPKLIAAWYMKLLRLKRIITTPSYPLSLPTYFGVVCQPNYFVLVQLPRKRYTVHDFKIMKEVWTLKRRKGQERCRGIKITSGLLCPFRALLCEVRGTLLHVVVSLCHHSARVRGLQVGTVPCKSLLRNRIRRTVAKVSWRDLLLSSPPIFRWYRLQL